ncbi:hypothetical protein [Baaleninema sp.]|uniref:hypothetical protein n=1 Tax=Baaleninema sp. TaxID=3101197 RepID=UPI003D046EB1
MTRDTAAIEAIALLNYYSFDLSGETAEGFVDRWLDRVPAAWLRLSVLEALYQGRYKGISVEHLLQLWLRRDRPFQHYSYEFERLVCDRLPGMPKPPQETPEIPTAEEVESETQDSEETPTQTPSLAPQPQIDRFTPSVERSPLHSKLKNFAVSDAAVSDSSEVAAEDPEDEARSSPETP